MDVKLASYKLLIIILPALTFLVIGIWTLPHYGMNWDEPIHFMRGQAYLHYFLTGEKDFKSLPPYPRLNANCVSDGKQCNDFVKEAEGTVQYRGNTTNEKEIFKDHPVKFLEFKRSYYQVDDYTFREFIATEEGHPPLGGILAALTNKIFYQYLHIMSDVESYHLFEVLISFTIVLAASVFVYYGFGVFAAVITGITLASYPLFFGESHFNIKDPPLAAFFGLTLISFYFGIIKGSWKLILASAVSFGMGMGVKFNMVFLPLIIIPWFLLYLIKMYLAGRYKISGISDIGKFIQTKLFVSIMLYPIVAALTFYAFWPFLWPDPMNSFLKILTFYEQIGTGTPPELTEYIINGWNTYPMLWIIYTTPIPVLFLSFIGIIGSTYTLIFRRNHLAILLLLWLIVPILRVSYPGTSIYGGVRQIMEYIPAMAVMAGVGAYYLIHFTWSLSGTRVAYLITLVIIASLMFTIYEIGSIHPNENVYFNQLIGGLSGAKAKDIPYWGNSYGNVYLQGIMWLNANAEPGAKLGFPVSTGGNLERVKLRPDILYWNAHWSGPKMGGEYEMELDFDWGPKQWYSYAYYDIFVEPVYVAKVDGVPLLKIWKNDLAHTKPGYEKEVEYKINDVYIGDGQIRLDIGTVIPLTRIVIEHKKIECQEQRGGYIATSEDQLHWLRDPETIASPQVPVNITGWDEDTFVFLFAARNSRYILLDTLTKDSCYLKNPKIKIYGLPDFPKNNL